MSGELGECLSYVVSRSGKVLDSSGRVLRDIVPASRPAITRARPLASFEGEAKSFFNLATRWLPPRDSPKKRRFHQVACCKPVVLEKKTSVWEDEIGSLEDVARAILRRQQRLFDRKSSRMKHGSENTGGSSERHRRLVQHLKVGVSQMLILQRWQSGSRELPAKWTSWLLKMLRKVKPPPQTLQRFLFTILVAILPVICCSLVCQTLSILPDSEVLKAVDILCRALEKSWSCFSPFQWEILEERIYQCQQVRLKAGTWLERRSKPREDLPLLKSSVAPTTNDKHRSKRVAEPSLSSSSDEYAVYNDEQMSNELVLSEGVKALVRRALRERQILPSFKRNHVPCIGSSEIRVSTLCPLSGMRLKIPARGVSCTHLTCFDLECYLKENAELAAGGRAQAAQRPMWRCPYCGSDATWPQIIVDGFFLSILKALPGNVLEVLIWPDGRWGATEPSAGAESSREKKKRLSDDGGRSSQDDTREQHRNVRPRLDDVSTDKWTWDYKEKRALDICIGNGNLSGNEARVSGTVSASQLEHLDENDHASVKQTTSALATPIPIPSKSMPALHQINLQDLIRSTLEKTRASEAEKTSEQIRVKDMIMVQGNCDAWNR